MADEKKTKDTPKLTPELMERIYKMRWDLTPPDVIAETLKLESSTVKYAIYRLGIALTEKKMEFPPLPRQRKNSVGTMAADIVSSVKVPKPKTTKE